MPARTAPWRGSRRTRPLVRAAIALAPFAVARTAHAQATPAPMIAAPAAPYAAPKVCVAVAGDPDNAVTEFAGRLHALLAARSDVRVIADERSRSALLGTAVAPGSPASSEVETALRRSRATLGFGDADGAALDAIAERLGCAQVTEISARPAGLAARGYDAVAHRPTFTLAPGLTDPRTVEAALVSAPAVAATPVQAPAAHPALPPPPPGAGAPSAPPARVLLAAPSDIAPTEDQRGRVAADVLAPPRSSAEPPRTTRTSPWPWVIAGGAAAALLTGFLVVQATGSNSTVVTVVRNPGGAP